MANKITINPKDGSMTLPPEALEVLGNQEALFIHIDKQNNAVIISTVDPIITANKKILDEMAEIGNELSDEDYYAPVPDSFLDKKKSNDD